MDLITQKIPETVKLISKYEKRQDARLNFRIASDSFYFNPQFLTQLRETLEDFKAKRNTSETVRVHLESLGIDEVVLFRDFRKLFNVIITHINEADTFIQFDPNQLFYDEELSPNADDDSVRHHDDQGIETYELLIDEFNSIHKRIEAGETSEEIAREPRRKEEIKKAVGEKGDTEKAAKILAELLAGQQSTQTGGGEGQTVYPTTPLNQNVVSASPFTPEQASVESSIEHALEMLLIREVARETVILENLVINTYDLSKYGVTNLPQGLEEVIRAKVRESILGLDIHKYLKADGTLDQTKIISLRAHLIRHALPAVMQSAIFQVGLAEMVSSNERAVQLAIEEEVLNQRIDATKAFQDDTFKDFFKEQVALEVIAKGLDPRDIIKNGKYAEVFSQIDTGEQSNLIQKIKERAEDIQKNGLPEHDTLAEIFKKTSVESATASAIFSDSTIIASLTQEFIETNQRIPRDFNELYQKLPKDYQELFQVLSPKEQNLIYVRFVRVSERIQVVLPSVAITQGKRLTQDEVKQVKLALVGMGGFFVSADEKTDDQAEKSYSDGQKNNFSKDVLKVAAISQLTDQRIFERVVQSALKQQDIAKLLENSFDLERWFPPEYKELFSVIPPQDRQRYLAKVLHAVEQTPKGGFGRILKDMVGRRKDLSVTDISTLFSNVDFSKLPQGGRVITPQEFLQLGIFTPEQQRELARVQKNNPEGIKLLLRSLRKVTDSDNGGLLNAPASQKLQEKYEQIKSDRQLIESGLTQLLKSHGIDGADQQVILRLLHAYGLTNSAIPDLQPNMEALYKQYGGRLKGRIDDLQRQLKSARKTDKIRELNEELIRSHALLNNLKNFTEVLATSQIAQLSAEEFVRQKKSVRLQQLAEQTSSEMSQGELEQLIQEEETARLLEMNALLEQYNEAVIADAVFQSELHNRDIAHVQQVHALRGLMLAQMSEADQRQIADALEVNTENPDWMDQLRTNVQVRGFGNDFPNLGAYNQSSSALSRLSNWRDRLNRLKSFKGKAVKKLAGKITKEGLKKVVVAVAPALGAGAAAALIAKLLGATVQVAAGAGLGGVVGGGIGFLVGGPLGAVAGGAIGGFLGGALSSSIGGETLVGGKALASDLASTAGKAAQTAGKALVEGATNTVTASTISPTLGVPVGAVVGGTVAGIGALGAFTLMTVLGAFLPDASSEFVGSGEISRFVEIRKSASPKAINNNEEREINYTITISPKAGYTITPTDITDTFSYLGGTSLSLTDQTAQILSLSDGPKIGQAITEPITFNYSTSMQGVDVLVINKFTLAFTATREGESEVDELSRSASVRIGNPKVGCIEFGPGGYYFQSDRPQTTIEWPEEDKNRLLEAFTRRLGTNTSAMELLCADGQPITVYRLNIPSGIGYHGFKNGLTLGFYTAAFGNNDNLEYVLTHELGHILDEKNPGLLQEFARAQTTNDCFSYPFGCAVAEAFAEGFADFIVYTTRPFGAYDDPGTLGNDGYNFKARWPNEFQWFKDNVFGGEECDVSSCTVQ